MKFFPLWPGLSLGIFIPFILLLLYWPAKDEGSVFVSSLSQFIGNLPADSKMTLKIVLRDSLNLRGNMNVLIYLLSGMAVAMVCLPFFTESRSPGLFLLAGVIALYLAGLPFVVGKGRFSLAKQVDGKSCEIQSDSDHLFVSLTCLGLLPSGPQFRAVADTYPELIKKGDYIILPREVIRSFKAAMSVQQGADPSLIIELKNVQPPLSFYVPTFPSHDVDTLNAWLENKSSAL